MIQAKSNDSVFARVFTMVMSFAIAMVLSVVSVPDSIAILRPDFVALVLIFWCLHHPGRVGLLIAFAVGVLLDTMYFGALGQHALSKLTIAYIVIRFAADRDKQDAILPQSAMILALLLLNTTIIAVTDRLIYGHFGPYTLWLNPFAGALLWCLAAYYMKVRLSRRYGVYE